MPVFHHLYRAHSCGLRIALFWVGMALCSAVHASIVIQGTRIVFAAEAKEATIQINNEGQSPALVQAWLDRGAAQVSPSDIDVPFVITPTLFRVEPGKGQALRIMYSGDPLPSDKESLFWLNVLDVAPKAKETQDNSGTLRFVFRSRIKLMYRPTGLPGTPFEAPGQLRWSLVKNGTEGPVLQATNPSAYVVNLGRIDLQAGGQTFAAGSGYVLPGESASFPVQDASGHALEGGSVVYSSLNDWGGSHHHNAALAP